MTFLPSRPPSAAAPPRALRIAALAGACVAALVSAGCDDLRAPSDARFTAVAGGDRDRGHRLVSQYQCGTCHVIPGVPGAGGTAAPTLDGFARRSFVAGSLPSNAAVLQRWLRDPPALVPGTAMPDLGVSEADARDMAAFLLSLR